MVNADFQNHPGPSNLGLWSVDKTKSVAMEEPVVNKTTEGSAGLEYNTGFFFFFDVKGIVFMENLFIPAERWILTFTMMLRSAWEKTWVEKKEWNCGATLADASRQRAGSYLPQNDVVYDRKQHANLPYTHFVLAWPSAPLPSTSPCSPRWNKL